MTKDEALRLALEALEYHTAQTRPIEQTNEAITAIKEALAQPEQCQCPNCRVTLHASDCAVHNEPAYPKGECNCGAQQEPEFFTHSVDQPYDWSEWVCPDPKGYLMKCCDCGLVHEAEFGVVRYKSETEHEDCDMLDDPNLQAVFRMRRSEQWSPSDMAHRAGGLTMEQPAQEPVATVTNESGNPDVTMSWWHEPALPVGTKFYTSPPAQRTWVGLTNDEVNNLAAGCHLGKSVQGAIYEAEAKLKEKNHD